VRIALLEKLGRNGRRYGHVLPEDANEEDAVVCATLNPRQDLVHLEGTGLINVLRFDQCTKVDMLANGHSITWICRNDYYTSNAQCSWLCRREFRCTNLYSTQAFLSTEHTYIPSIPKSPKAFPRQPYPHLQRQQQRPPSAH
jgi:hypothetical protein